jgi:LacI family transcriptional regulator
VGIVELQDNPENETAGVSFDQTKIGRLAIETLVGLMYRNETGVPANPYELMLAGEWRAGSTLPPRVLA